MAITEEHRRKIEDSSKEEAIKEAKEIIKAAARYERLAVNKDFIDVINDLKGVKETHDQQAKGWLEQIEGMSLFKSMRLLEVIKVHQIRANQLNEAINYIPRIMKQADEARMFLRAITEEEQSHATRN